VDARRIESRGEFEAELGSDWDLILSDYNLPGFSGLQALDLLRASGRLWPFILVSGEIGEDTAVEAMQARRLPAEEQPCAPGPGDGTRDRGRRGAALCRR
jgi:CheY-like chemotaxis protein